MNNADIYKIDIELILKKLIECYIDHEVCPFEEYFEKLFSSKFCVLIEKIHFYYKKKDPNHYINPRNMCLSLFAFNYPEFINNYKVSANSSSLIEFIHKMSNDSDDMSIFVVIDKIRIIVESLEKKSYNNSICRQTIKKIFDTFSKKMVENVMNDIGYAVSKYSELSKYSDKHIDLCGYNVAEDIFFYMAVLKNEPKFNVKIGTFLKKSYLDNIYRQLCA